jgi:hypothetical protein
MPKPSQTPVAATVFIANYDQRKHRFVHLDRHRNLMQYNALSVGPGADLFASLIRPQRNLFDHTCAMVPKAQPLPRYWSIQRGASPQEVHPYGIDGDCASGIVDDLDTNRGNGNNITASVLFSRNFGPLANNIKTGEQQSCARSLRRDNQTLPRQAHVADMPPKQESKRRHCERKRQPLEVGYVMKAHCRISSLAFDYISGQWV